MRGKKKKKKETIGAYLFHLLLTKSSARFLRKDPFLLRICIFCDLFSAKIVCSVASKKERDEKKKGKFSGLIGRSMLLIR